jgi:hypothetical protein
MKHFAYVCQGKVAKKLQKAFSQQLSAVGGRGDILTQRRKNANPHFSRTKTIGFLKLEICLSYEEIAKH